MTGNQALLLVLALGGAAVLIAAGAASRPLHGLAVAPFAMAAFALSSQNSRDLRSGVLAGAASLLVLSAADARAVVMTLCAVGLVPMVFAWAAVRQLMFLDRHPHVVVAVSRGPRPWPWALVARLVVVTAAVALLMPTEPAPHLHGGDGDAGSGDQSTPDPGERGYGHRRRLRRPQPAASGAGSTPKPAIDVPAASPTLWQGGFVDTVHRRRLEPDLGADGPADGHRRCRPRQRMPSGRGYAVATVDRLPAGDPALVYSPGPLVAVDAAAGRLYSLVAGIVAIDRPRQPAGTRTRSSYRDNGTTSAGHAGRRLPLRSPTPAGCSCRPSCPRGCGTSPVPSPPPRRRPTARSRAIEDYLRTHEKYSLDSPVPARRHRRRRRVPVHRPRRASASSSRAPRR